MADDISHFISTKPDTYYRYYKRLHEKGVLQYEKQGSRDCFYVPRNIAENYRVKNSDNDSSNRKIFRTHSENLPTYPTVRRDSTVNPSSSLRSEEGNQDCRAKKTRKQKRKKKERLAEKDSTAVSPVNASSDKGALPARAEKPPNLPYRLWETWRDRVAEHFSMPPAPRPEAKHMHHLKHLGKKLAARIAYKIERAPSEEEIVNGFDVFVRGALEAADDWQERNFTPDILHAQLDRLILAIRQKQMGPKKKRKEDAEWQAMVERWREEDRINDQNRIQA